MKKTLCILIVLSLALVCLCSCGQRVRISQPVEPNTQTASPGSEKTTIEVIGEEKAKEIALKKAELTADEVRFGRIELDFDNGVWQYEVEFRKERIEYSVDINAQTGEIISYEMDSDD